MKEEMHGLEYIVSFILIISTSVFVSTGIFYLIHISIMFLFIKNTDFKTIDIFIAIFIGLYAPVLLIILMVVFYFKYLTIISNPSKNICMINGKIAPKGKMVVIFRNIFEKTDVRKISKTISKTIKIQGDNSIIIEMELTHSDIIFTQNTQTLFESIKKELEEKIKDDINSYQDDTISSYCYHIIAKNLPENIKIRNLIFNIICIN
jgi:hypothetical protein